MQNIFASMDHLRPKCPGCGVVLEFGDNTSFSDEHDAHVCAGCGHVLSESLDKEISMGELPEDEP